MTTDEMIEILEGIVRDENTNATARCTAIRTLMQIEDDGGSREGMRSSSGSFTTMTDGLQSSTSSRRAAAGPSLLGAAPVRGKPAR